MPDWLPYEDLNDQMVAAIPALGEAYQRQCGWWDGEQPPPHVLFGEILNPHLSRLLLADDGQELTTALTFLERMAGDIDPRVQDVLRDTVLEHIRDEPLLHRTRAQKLMGPKTLVHWQRLTATS